MSIELPKYTISQAEQPTKKNKVLIYPVLIISGLLIGYFSSGYVSKNIIKTLHQRNSVLEDLNTINKENISQLKSNISLLTTEKKVKKEASQQLQKSYKTLIENQSELVSEINFYERLLSPNTQNKGLRVFETSLSVQKNNRLLLKTILVQKIERAREIAGRYSIELIGLSENKQKTITISKKDEASFTFKYFYNISLSFSLPEGFKPEQLVVKLYPKIKKAKPIEYKVDWLSLIIGN